MYIDKVIEIMLTEICNGLAKGEWKKLVTNSNDQQRVSLNGISLRWTLSTGPKGVHLKES